VEGRDSLIEAARARLARVAASQDLSLVLEAEAQVESDRLAEAFSQGHLEAGRMLGWVHWFRYQALPEGGGSAGP
jgi:hypothetical protein